jgi:hypothetical protein
MCKKENEPSAFKKAETQTSLNRVRQASLKGTNNLPMRLEINDVLIFLF